MANDLSTLNGYLATELRDTAYAVWTTGEMNNLLTWSAARLSPSVSERDLADIALVDDQALYSVTGWININRIDWYNGNPATTGTDLLNVLGEGSWELLGDRNAPATRSLYINPLYAKTGYYLRVHGYKAYDLTANLPSDNMVPAILAMARAEAYRRMAGKRSQSEQWAALNQKESVSVNELMQMIKEAEDEARLRMREIRTRQMPVPARVG